MGHATFIDTHVIDDPDARSRRPSQQPIAVGRVPTGELTMQVIIDGTWHRRTPDLAHTACALEIDSQFNKLRREELTEPLCRLCFTAFEISQAKECP